MNRKMDHYQSWLDSEKQRLNEAIELLEQEGRTDEANWNKVRLNITEAFETIAAADVRYISRQEGDALTLFQNRYLPRFADMSAKWRAQLDKAALHGDTAAAAIETIKIETAARIEAAFRNAEE